MSLRASCVIAWLVALTAGAATVRGVVTGDVSQMPWRKGKRELGWCAVELIRDGRAERVSRSNAGTGAFEIHNVAPGKVQIGVGRPGFVNFAKLLDIADRDPEPLRFHINRDPDYGLIILPRTGTAITRVPGETFAVECAAPSEAKDWEVRLLSDGAPCSLTLLTATFGERLVWNGTRPGWRLSVRVPATAVAGMHALRVAYTDRQGGRHKSSQQSAVCIRPAYPSRFRLMPYCDFHFDWLVGRPGAAGEVQADYFRAASLLNPLFVSLGDDIGFEGDDHVAMFHDLVTQHLRVPVYLAFGNHDGALGPEGHAYYFGPRWQKRRIGPHVGLILSYDLYQGNYQIPQAQRDWVNATLAQFHGEPDNRLIFLAGHLNAWKPPTPFFTLPFTKQARPMFPGHSDGRVSIEFQRLFMHALSVGSMHGWAGLNYTGRVMEFDAWKRATLLPQCALPTVRFDGPNNGTASTATATIRLLGLEKWTPPEKLYTGGYFCDLPKAWEGLPEIRDARLRFVMSRGRYRCSPGRILRQVDGAAGKATVVHVAVDVREPVLSVAVSPDPNR